MATIIDAYPVGHPRHRSTNGEIPTRYEYLCDVYGYLFQTPPISGPLRFNKEAAAVWAHECREHVLPRLLEGKWHPRVLHVETRPGLLLVTVQ